MSFDRPKKKLIKGAFLLGNPKQIFDLKIRFCVPFLANPNLDFGSNESFLGKDSLDLKSANLNLDL